MPDVQRARRGLRRRGPRRCAAIRDGDEWIVNGQKVWTTLAHVARFGIVLVRTDPEQVKHKGMTMFVIDMHAPGVEVRPLVQATGEAEFNEVYMTDVRIADRERLGDVGEGWHVSLTTLMNERVSIGGQVNPRGSGVIAVAVEPVEAATRSARTPSRATRSSRLWIDAEVNRLTNMRASQTRAQGHARARGLGRQARDGRPQPADHELRHGPHGSRGAAVPDAATRWSGPAPRWTSSNPQKAFLRVQANSIEGGTTNIMKNILGERVLGLPGRAPGRQGRPWSQVPGAERPRS